ncbi:TetR/AcrR family transcriptional regulator [Geodermatophilus sp. URMC 61]|uniref:TetR/AcrR family transcriptional regulator n=1 Tax=Geodermatophilus sp. URMC 61 TaxID=3423411 RepID=UPI00406BF7AF
MRSAVLSAVTALLAEGGFDALSMEAVAARSGVHRTTVYRRWGSTAMLLVDLLDLGTEDDWRPPDTGCLEEDLVAINREVCDALTADPSPTVAVIAASFRSAEAAEALSRFWADRYRRCAVVVDRAVARGEVPAETDAHRLLVAATGPLYHLRVLLRRPLGQADADAFARAAAAAATTACRLGATLPPPP